MLNFILFLLIFIIPEPDLLLFLSQVASLLVSLPINFLQYVQVNDILTLCSNSKVMLFFVQFMESKGNYFLVLNGLTSPFAHKFKVLLLWNEFPEA
mmetsp:Transcript_11207/g.11274  ORF Transcript_11207/g.11274 Transcript_11207/m.11274 type:complete len:96 (-) Transcript_11207:950-1237(-)